MQFLMVPRGKIASFALKSWRELPIWPMKGDMRLDEREAYRHTGWAAFRGRQGQSQNVLLNSPIT